MWRWLLGLLFIALTSLASLNEAKADIVFINLNGGVTEIPAAEAVARKNGERLYVIPQAGTTRDDYETPQVLADLMTLAKQGVRPRSLIVSGHHSRVLGFWGTNGEVSMYYIEKILPREGQPGYELARDFFAGIDSLYLWGCYTGILGNVYRTLNGSNAAFKNVKYVVAFGEKGPLNTDPLSGRMLKDVLEKESALRSGSLEQTYQILKTVPGYQQKDLFVHRGQSFVSQSGPSSQEEFQAACREDGFKNKLADSIRTYWDYYWNKKGPIPENTSNGELRQAYKTIQRYDYCLKVSAVNFGKDFYEIPEQQAVLRLIFSKNVMINFASLYATQLRYAQSELQRNGLTGSEVLGTFAQADRGAMMTKLTDLHAQVKKLFPDKTNPEQYAKYLYLNKLIDDIEWVLYPTKDFYVPLRWIDPNSTDLSNAFQVLNNFEKAQNAARAKAGLN